MNIKKIKLNLKKINLNYNLNYNYVLKKKINLKKWKII